MVVFTIIKTHSENQNKEGLQSPQDPKVEKREEYSVPGNITVAVRLTEVFMMIEIYISWWV